MPAKKAYKYTKEKIVLVDPHDHEIGTIEKVIAHEYGMLHRAFSVLIFRTCNKKLQTLIQQRSFSKYHCAGLWTNSCCSHPHFGEDETLSAEKRLKKEMGIKVKLHKIGKFHYIASFNNGLTENEIDHVLVGEYESDDIPVNKAEVANYCWMDVQALKRDLRLHPKKYTPWFKEALEVAVTGYKKNKGIKNETKKGRKN